jgi:hypothetical protein
MVNSAPDPPLEPYESKVCASPMEREPKVTSNVALSLAQLESECNSVFYTKVVPVTATVLI